jgi:tripartite-type tricarboxylate transporter receptor subunit TctC
MTGFRHAAFAASFVLLGVDANAQQFPTRPITVMVGLAAGGLTNVTTRTYTEAVTKITGWAFVVENRAGAGGAVAAAAVQNATPDGQTLLIFSGSQHATIAAITPEAYQPVKGFAPITLLFNSVAVLAVPGSSPVKSAKELFDFGRAKSGGLLFATQGIGSPTHILGAKLAAAAAVPLEFVHYRGGSAMMTDFIAGRVDFALPTMTTAAPFIKDGRIRALAVDADTRLATLPDVPTLAELGFKKERVASWFGLAAPAGTAPSVVERLREAFVTASQDPALKQRLSELETPIVTSSPQEMASRRSATLPRFWLACRASDRSRVWPDPKDDAR